jgi:hypothetical protein
MLGTFTSLCCGVKIVYNYGHWSIACRLGMNVEGGRGGEAKEEGKWLRNLVQSSPNSFPEYNF